MTTPARIREAEEASAAFQLALAQLGVETVAEALELWQTVNPTRLALTAELWLNKAIELILSRRLLSHDLAIAYYRLARALRTGTTIADPALGPPPRFVTLEALRREFWELADVESDLPPDEVADELEELTDEQLPGADGDERIPVEELDGFDDDAERLEREAREQAAIVLDALGPLNLERKLDESGVLDDDLLEGLTAREVDEAREKAHREAGARQAAAVDRLAKNGARDLLAAATKRDPRAIGYVRLSRTGTPCGWCAMLISRGFVPKPGGRRGDLYQSQSSAGPTLAQLESGEYAEGDKYHDNCNCYAEPVFSDDQLNNSPLYVLNRQYAKEWPRVTRGKSGKAALSAWRRYIRDLQR
jgi:hypothetical protein